MELKDGPQAKHDDSDRDGATGGWDAAVDEVDW